MSAFAPRRVCDLPSEERPRERLARQGAGALSNRELIALLLGTGTRRASGKILTALAPVLPELWGGSADLAESNNTTMEGEPSFIPADHQTAMWPGGPYGRTLHFGIREHGMGSIMNGMRNELPIVISVRTNPGQTVSTCTPWGASDPRIASSMVICAALVAP